MFCINDTNPLAKVVKDLHVYNSESGGLHKRSGAVCRESIQRTVRVSASVVFWIIFGSLFGKRVFC